MKNTHTHYNNNRPVKGHSPDHNGNDYQRGRAQQGARDGYPSSDRPNYGAQHARDNSRDDYADNTDGQAFRYGSAAHFSPQQFDDYDDERAMNHLGRPEFRRDSGDYGSHESGFGKHGASSHYRSDFHPEDFGVGSSYRQNQSAPNHSQSYRPDRHFSNEWTRQNNGRNFEGYSDEPHEKYRGWVYGASADNAGHGHAHHSDSDYHQWRSEQIQNLDRDYQDWRHERYNKFSDEFNNWRSARPAKSNREDHRANELPDTSGSRDAGKNESAGKGDAPTAGKK